MNLLEPVDEVSVLVPDDLVGAVMSDLSGRRGRVLGTDKVGEDRTLVKAEVPAGRADPLRHRPALALARRRIVHPVVRALRADARVGSGQGEDDPPEALTRNLGAHRWCL